MTRRTFQHFLLLTIVVASLSIRAGAPVGSWWSTTSDYRYQIFIPAGASALQNNYSIPITFDHAAAVAAGRSLASGDDVRIVWWNGSTWVELDRVLDPDSSWNSASTTIWFRTQSAIGAGATDDNYYLYFGDLAAGAPPANGDNVFLLYDDFESGFSTARWNRSNNTNVFVSGGTLTVRGGRQIRSDASFGLNTIYEVRSRVATASPSNDQYYLAGDNDCSDFSFDGYIRFDADNNATDALQISGGTATPGTFTPTSPTNYQLYSFTREAGGAGRFFHNGAQLATYTGASTANMCMFMRNDSGTSSQTMEYEWARVRAYRNPEPVPSLGPLEQQPMPSAVAEWRMDQSSWNGTAGEVVDAGGNGLNGRAFNGANTANVTPAIAGDPGTCRYGSFNGTSQYLEVADNALLDQNTQLTVTAWVYPRSYGTELKTIVSKDTNYEFHLDGSVGGEVYWWWNDTNGNTRFFRTTGYPVPLNQWTHIAITYRSGVQRIYLNGVVRGSAAYTGTLVTNNLPLQIGQDQDVAGRYWNGLIDEVRVYGAALSAAQVNTVMNETHPCSSANHFLIAHDGFGITCAAVENVTVTVHDLSHNPVTSYNKEVTLDTQTGRGTWTLVSGGGTFTDAVTNDGLATYVWPLGQSTATFALDYRSALPPATAPPGALSMDIDVYETSNPALRDDDTEGQMVFSPSGFVVTSSPLSNPPPNPIPSFASPQVAGTNFTAYLTAFGQTPTDPQCGVIEGYAGNHNLKFWSTYVNPNTGTRNVTINASNIATTEASSSAQVVNFTAGQASVTARYQDVGLINIQMKDDTTGNPGLPNGIRGSTGNFVVRPSTFVISNIKRTSDNVANPIAANANGPVFIAAGQAFTATVTAQDSTGAATPNFGKESTPESVRLVPTLVLPAGGANPAISAPLGFNSFSNGVSTGTDFSWPEVGIITLTPHIKDGDYLGIGDVVGVTTGNVGRFIPFDFAVSPNTPSFQTACASGNFTYIGQPFTYAVAPVWTVTARNASGGTTANYTGVFFKITNSSLTNRTYAVVGATLDTSGLPSAASDPSILDLTGGQASLTYGAGSGLAISRSTPAPPFNAQISLSQNIIDSDGVAASNPVSFNNIAFSAGSEQRYGRIAFRNAVGSELLNLPVPMHAEYFQSAAVGFVQNAADSCTSGVGLSLGGFGGNLNAGETCVLDTGSPGVSGAGCSVAGPVGQRFRMPPAGGDFVAILRAPGTGNNGTVTVTTVVPSWLRFDWNVANPGFENPSGIATFGIFQGESRRIFQIEK